MLEKLDDRFDKAKYCSMIKKILQEEFCLDFLFEMEKNHKNEEISKKIINIFEAYLKFSISNRITNPNTSKFSDVGS